MSKLDKHLYDLEMKHSSNTTALGAALATVFFWSLAYPGSRAALHYLSPEHIALLRFVVASLFFVPFLFTGRLRRVRWLDLIFMTLLGATGISLYQLLFVYGMQSVASSAGSLVIGSVPVFSALLARVLFGERLSPYGWFGIGLSLFGVSILAVSDLAQSGLNKGILFLVLAALATSFYFVLQKGLIVRYGPFTVTAYSIWLGTVPLLFFTPGIAEALSHTPALIIGVVVTMGLIGSGLAYTLWFFALSRASAGIVTSFLFLQPLFAGILAWLWLGETVSMITLVGGSLSVSGVALVIFKGKDLLAETAETQRI